MSGWQILGLVLLSPLAIAWLLVVGGLFCYYSRQLYKEGKGGFFLCLSFVVVILISIFLVAGGLG